jgi:hypothetical protein
MKRHSILETVMVLAAYAVLSLLLTYPLILNFSEAIPGTSGDGPMNVWNLWWTKYALLDLRTNPFYTNHIFYPEGVSLAFHAHTFLFGLISIPFQVLFDVVTAYNIIIILSLTLCGLGAYVLAKYLTGNAAAAFISGIIYAVSPYIFAHLSGHLNYVAAQWIPFYIFFLVRMKAESASRARNGVLAGLFLLCAGWSEYTYLIFLLIFTALYVGYEFVLDRRSVFNSSFIRGFAGLMAVFLLGFWPAIYFGIKAIIEGEYQEIIGPVGADVYVADLLSFIIPSVHHSIWGECARLIARHFTGTPMEWTVFPGYVVTVLAVYALVQRFANKSTVRFWGLCLIVFSSMALGSHLHVLGRDTRIPMPFIIFESLPVLRNLRAPGRFGIMLMLCFSVLSAFSLVPLFERIRTRAGKAFAAIVVSSLIVLEYLPIPYPMHKTVAPSIYQEIGRDTEDVTVLEIPLGWHTGFWSMGHEDPITYYFQSVHQKRVIGGTVSRCPVDKAQWISTLPVIGTIIKLEEGTPVSVTPNDKQVARDLARLLRIKYVVVQKRHADAPAHDYLLRVMPMKKIFEDGTVIAYRIDRGSPG